MNTIRRSFRVRRPYVWYYRTEVRDNLKAPVRIIEFNGDILVNGKWIRSNVLGRELGTRDFVNWYSDGDPVPDGWIAPGKTAACDPNWTYLKAA